MFSEAGSDSGSGSASDILANLGLGGDLEDDDDDGSNPVDAKDLGLDDSDEEVGLDQDQQDQQDSGADACDPAGLGLDSSTDGGEDNDEKADPHQLPFAQRREVFEQGRPQSEVAASRLAGGLPPGWETSTDPASGKPFYFNRATGVSRWDPPSRASSDAGRSSINPAEYHAEQASERLSTQRTPHLDDSQSTRIAPDNCNASTDVDRASHAVDAHKQEPRRGSVSSSAAGDVGCSHDEFADQAPIDGVDTADGDASAEVSWSMGDNQDSADLEVFRQLANGRTFLSLKDLCLQSIEPLGLPKIASLTTLHMPGNEFINATALADSLDQLKSLTDLDISRCHLKELPVLKQLHNLCRINASQNMLRSSRGILYCTELRNVVLSHNHLKRVEQLETLCHLEELDVSRNSLGPTALAAMRTVAACGRLRVIYVAGNPFANSKAHHVQLTDLIPSLELIDNRRVQTLRSAKKHRAASNGKVNVPVRCSSQKRIQSTAAALDQSVSVADTSLGYGMLARNSPNRQPHRRTESRYRSPPRRALADLSGTPGTASKLAEKQTPARNRILPRTGTPKTSTKLVEVQQSKQKPLQNAACKRSPIKSLRPNRSSPSLIGGNSPCKPSKPWVIASCLVSLSKNARESRCQVLRSPCKLAPNETLLESSSIPVDQSQVLSDGADVKLECEATDEDAIPTADVECSEVKSERRFTLEQLLEEKRRLLRRVSSRLSSGTDAHTDDLPTVPQLPADVAPVVSSQQADTAGHPVVNANADAVAGACRRVVSTAEMRSLRESLHDGIERKRALLDKLKHI